jgi:hypothetical protein
MRRTLDGRDKQTCPRRGCARRTRLDRHGLQAVEGLSEGTATRTVDRAGKLPRRFLSNQSLGAPIERGITSLFNHWLSAVVRPGPATALVCRFTSKTASQLTNMTIGLNGGAFRPVNPKITNERSSPKDRRSTLKSSCAVRSPAATCLTLITLCGIDANDPGVR